MRTLRDHPRLVRHGVAAIVLAAVVIVPFHAIFAHPGSRMVGVGDGTGTLRKLWAASTLQRTPLSFDHDALLGAPEGSTVVPAANLANGGVETAFIWELKGPLGLVGAYNAFMFLGLFATGLALYAFLTYLGCTFGASLLGGAVFALSPYAVERAYAGHAGFMHNWIFVLLAWLMLRLAERRSWRVAAGAGLALALAFYLSAYQALLGSAVVFAFLVVDLVRTRERGERLRVLARGAVICAVALLALAPILVLYAKEHAAVTFTLAPNADSIVNYGAALRAYLIPSLRNPLIPWLRRFHPTEVTDQTLFFGYGTWLLALVATVLTARRNQWLRASDRRWHAALCLLTLAPTAFLMSLPPREHVFGLSIPTPPVVVESLTTYWRIYARFGIVVGLAVISLAALALSTLSRRPGRGWRLLTPLAAVVAVLELFPGNVRPFDATAAPGWVAWLRSHPGGIVSTYPWVTGGDRLAIDTWYQVLDGHPRFVSGDPRGRLGAIRLLTRDSWRPVTPHILAAEDVKYVVVQQENRSRAPSTDPADFTLVYRAGGASIYEVHAAKTSVGNALRENAGVLASLQGLAPALAYGSGFNPPEPYEHTIGRWLIQDGEIELQAHLATRLSLAGLAFSNGSPRTLELLDASGRVLGRSKLTSDPAEIALGPFSIPAGSTTVRLVATPGPVPFGGGDTRRASVFIGPLAANALPPYLEHPAGAGG